MNDGIRNDAQAEIARGPFPWQRGWSIVKAIWPQLIYISMAAIAIPQYGLYLFSAQRAAEHVQNLAIHPINGFMPLLQFVEKFSISGLLHLSFAALFAVIGYLAWITSVWQHMCGQKIGFFAIIVKSLRTLVPSGLITIILFGIGLLALLAITAIMPMLALFSQLFLISFCVLAAAAPVLLVAEQGGARHALSSAYRMQYTKGSGVSRWSAYFILLTYEMLLMGSLSLIEAGQEALNNLDQILGLPRTFWFKTNPTFPFGILPMGTEVLAISLSTLMFALFAVMSTSFVVDLRRIARLRSAIEIRV